MTLDEYRIAFRTLKVARADGRSRPRKAAMLLDINDLSK